VRPITRDDECSTSNYGRSNDVVIINILDNDTRYIAGAYQRYRIAISQHEFFNRLSGCLKLLSKPGKAQRRCKLLHENCTGCKQQALTMDCTR
jgi:hypothetical protein